MSRVRVYELAKEAGMSSKALAEKLIEQGYDIKGHSSTVDAEEAEQIRKSVLKTSNTELVEKRISDNKGTTVIRRRSKVIRRRPEAEPEEAPMAEDMEESPEEILEEVSEVDDKKDEEIESIEEPTEEPTPERTQTEISEKEVIYDLFKDRVGEVVSGIVQRFERGNMIVNLGRTDAIMPKDQQIPKRSFKQGDRIRAYLLDVQQNSRHSQLLLSRTCDEFLEKLFVLEVPEIAEGIVKIMGISRDPGFRAKIAVSSLETDVDPVGACVGMKGSRVQNVVQELQGERIDIVPWSPDPAKYVYNALAPARVSMVMADEEAKTLLVVVPNDQLSLAIGRQGQNVRLASKLLGWRIDVKSEQRYANLDDKGYQSLLAIEGIGETLADKLFAREIKSAADMAKVSIEDLTIIRAIDDEQAEFYIEAAKKLIEQGDYEPESSTEEPSAAEEQEATEQQKKDEEQEEPASDTDKKEELVGEATEEPGTDDGTGNDEKVK